MRSKCANCATKTALKGKSHCSCKDRKQTFVFRNVDSALKCEGVSFFLRGHSSNFTFFVKHCDIFLYEPQVSEKAFRLMLIHAVSPWDGLCILGRPETP